MALPLDGDGFLRRECPDCEREFKWLATESDNADSGSAAAPQGYFCPYCGVQAPPDAWFTKIQLDHARAKAVHEVVGPELKKFRDSVRRSSTGFIKVDVRYEEPQEPQRLIERDDMRRVDFPCHPAEPVKVLDDWTGPVHCLICGAPAPSTRSS
jgi:hypothetical protein